MADEEVVVKKTPAELHAEQKEAEEARLANQTEYDPKQHGAGTQPIVEPQSVSELFKIVLQHESRLRALEYKVRR